jgi:hypothetical protein
MSDASQGPGWWQASDAKWYAPEQHPDAITIATAAAAEAAAAAAEAEAEPDALPNSPWVAPDGDDAGQWGGSPQDVQRSAWSDSGTGDWSTMQPAAAATGQAKASLVRKPAFLVVAAIVILAVIGGVIAVSMGGSSSSARSLASTVVGDLQKGDFAQVCTLALQAQSANCTSQLGSLSTHKVSYKIALGTVTVNGDRAVFVLTGTVCEGKTFCDSNHDGNLATDKGQSFDQAYTSAVGPSSEWVVPELEQNGKWYISSF